MRPDDAFCDCVVGRLADLPGVRAVALGGSRAAGTNRPDSDWDFAVYYRGAFSPDSLRGRGAYAAHGRLTETAGTIATATCQAAHAVLAAAGQWVTNEKALLDRAGLRGMDEILAGLTPDAGRLARAFDDAEALLQAVITGAGVREAPACSVDFMIKER